MYQKCGTKTRARFTDISKLSDALIGMHSFTGCYTVSTFTGRGKSAMFKQFKISKTCQDTFRKLGSSWEVSDELFRNLQEVTCRIYLPSTSTTEVNKLRYHLFCAKRGEVDSSQLPSCEDCFFMHALRANYQAAIWRRCLESNPSVPHPTDHGWKVNDGDLAVEWMRGKPAPEAVLDLLSCSCARSCKLLLLLLPLSSSSSSR